jgi:transcriptional regulator with GAF, ATPase, and Fis domain
MQRSEQSCAESTRTFKLKDGQSSRFAEAADVTAPKRFNVPCAKPEKCHVVTDLAAIVETQRAIATSDLKLDTVMQLICQRGQELTRALGAVVEMPEGDMMVYRAGTALFQSYLGLSLPIASSLSGLCLMSAKPLRCDDTQNDPRVNREACRKVHVASMIVVPLLHQGKTVGVLKVFSGEKNFFDESAVEVLELLAGIMAAALSNSLMFQANQDLINELQIALANVKQLKGLLPICCQCKKIRDDRGYWNRIETYISEHTDADFSHGYCPECANEFRRQNGVKET